MKICFNELLLAVSAALDCVEKDLLGVSTNHSKRVAYLCSILGKKSGMDSKQISDLVGCAVLHDNALTEYIQAEYLSTGFVSKKMTNQQLGIHCSMGECNIKNFPFFYDVEKTILYHHENADGTGPFGKRSAEIPLYAAYIHIADQIDAKFSLSEMYEEKYLTIRKFILENYDVLFGKNESDLFLESIDYEIISTLSDENIECLLKESIPFFETDFEPSKIMNISSIFAKIVDYKSTFTSLHSMGIAHKVYKMGSFYGYNEEMCSKLFLAGALHDIGKLGVDTEILEKPDKLTIDEFEKIKKHASLTYEILSQVKGFKDITSWASLHHEKLNGKGYPFGYNAEQLGFQERLLGCIDIYQALTEDRPYKKGFSHEKAMDILYEMKKEGFIDGGIVEDIDKVFQ